MLHVVWRRRQPAAADTIIMVVHDVVLSLNAEEPTAQFKLVHEGLEWGQRAKDGFSGNDWWQRIL